MICDDAAQYVSALCDGETIPPAAAQHIGSCPDCRVRLSDYLAFGVELRRAASLELADAMPSRSWAKPPNRVATLWQKGWGTMRIPRLAFVVLITGIVVLASALVVNRARASNTGTVVLLSTEVPNGWEADCPLSTQAKNQSCYADGHVGSSFLAYKIRLLSRDGDRVLLGVRTLTYPVASGSHNLSSFVNSNEPGKKVWFAPGEPLEFHVPGVGALTLKGVWMDHVPVLGKLDPGPNELRLGRPLLLKDKVMVGDLSSSIGGVYGQDDPDWAMVFYIRGQGRFVLSELPMKGAVEAQVALGRVSFRAAGHSWELVSGVPVSRAKHLWVLYQPKFRMATMGWHAVFGNTKLVQVEPGVWVPQERPK
ncbi:MAG: hypothetical protein WB819_20300 [Terriglobia bacterium]